MKKQTKTIRFLAFFLVLAVFAFALAGCASSDNDDNAAGDDSQGESRAYQQYMDWLKQYDKWVDSYINVCKNYNKNPAAYMSDYLTKTAELTEWTAKFANVDDDDDLTAAEAAKISKEYLRIYNKMISAIQ